MNQQNYLLSTIKGRIEKATQEIEQLEKLQAQETDRIEHMFKIPEAKYLMGTDPINSIEWVKLLDEKPKKEDIYKCLCFDKYGERWKNKFLKWTSEGFQPLNYGEPDTYPINMDVSHWLKVHEPIPPVPEAEKLVIDTEVFFISDELEEFVSSNNIKVYSRYANAIKVIVSDLPQSVLKEMRKKFRSNGIFKHVRKF